MLKYRETINIISIMQGPQDDYGQHSRTDNLPITTYAEIKTLSGRLAETVKAVYPLATHSVSIRYTAVPIRPVTHKLTCGSRTFNILNVIPDVTKREIVITVTEVV